MPFWPAGTVLAARTAVGLDQCFGVVRSTVLVITGRYFYCCLLLVARIVSAELFYCCVPLCGNGLYFVVTSDLPLRGYFGFGRRRQAHYYRIFFFFFAVCSSRFALDRF